MEASVEGVVLVKDLEPGGVGEDQHHEANGGSNQCGALAEGLGGTWKLISEGGTKESGGTSRAKRLIDQRDTEGLEAQGGVTGSHDRGRDQEFCRGQQWNKRGCWGNRRKGGAWWSRRGWGSRRSRGPGSPWWKLSDDQPRFLWMDGEAQRSPRADGPWWRQVNTEPEQSQRQSLTNLTELAAKAEPRNWMTPVGPTNPENWRNQWRKWDQEIWQGHRRMKVSGRDWSL